MGNGQGSPVPGRTTPPSVVTRAYRACREMILYGFLRSRNPCDRALALQDLYWLGLLRLDSPIPNRYLLAALRGADPQPRHVAVTILLDYHETHFSGLGTRIHPGPYLETLDTIAHTSRDREERIILKLLLDYPWDDPDLSGETQEQQTA